MNKAFGTFASAITLAAGTATAQTVFMPGDGITDTTNPIGVAGDAAPGFGTGSRDTARAYRPIGDAPTARAMSTAQPKVTQDGERRGLITIAPGDDGTPHTATFIGPIHGLGDTNMGWAQQAMMLHQQLPWVKFVLPNAPTSPVTAPLEYTTSEARMTSKVPCVRARSPGGSALNSLLQP